MFLIKLLFWLLTLPFRLLFFILGLALWVLTLPLRITFGILGIIGLWRIMQLGLVAGIGYFFYRLINEATDSEASIATEPTSPTELRSYPST